nr:aminodeoxychorismate synthase component I [Paenibacillus oenotherae]
MLIDNYDSYTFNLYQLLADINGEEPFVIRNDALQWQDIEAYRFDNIVISPGPGSPGKAEDFGISAQAIAHAEVPVLGVCLGHQGIGHLFGSKVVHAPEAMHGRLSEIHHNESALFAGIPQGSPVVRYHSLMVEHPLSDDLEATAWTQQDGIIMGLQHKNRPIWGVQFHPESIATTCGRQLLVNFKALTQAYWSQSRIDKAGRLSLESLVHKNIVPAASQTANNHSATADEAYTVTVRRIDGFALPEQVYSELYAGQPYSFWLDSSRAQPGMARFSFMGAYGGPYSQRLSYCAETGRLEITTAAQGITTVRNESVYDYIERIIQQVNCCDTDVPFDYNTGFVGYFGYEMKAESGGDHPHSAVLPDAAFILADRIVVFDHLERQMYLLGLTPHMETSLSMDWFAEMEQRLATVSGIGTVLSGIGAAQGAARVEVPVEAPLAAPVEAERAGALLAFKLHRSYDEYMQSIAQTKGLLREGETYEINLTNEISCQYEGDPFLLYLNIRKNNPAPYSAYMQFGDYQILCSSPERFVKIDRHGGVEAKPIKGTIRRGATAQEDEWLRTSLQSSEKDRSENLMIVDLLRNDLGIVCEVGSVRVPKLMDIESYETVHQMVSTVCGQLRSGLTAVSCIRAAFPGGSMTGAPKIRSMQIIDQLEARPRGIYSGSIGFLAVNGSADMNIVIRTIVSHQGGLTIGVGGAVVMLSEAEAEYDEILLKADVLIKSIVQTKYPGREYDRSMYRLLGDRSEDKVEVGGAG